MKPDWKVTLYPHAWLRHVDVMRNFATQLEYPFFMWNGRIYQTSDGKEIGIMKE